MSSKLDKFSQDGFVALPQVVSGAEFAELLAQIQRFIAEVLPGLPPEHVFYEDKEDPATLKQIQQMGQHDAWFHELFTAGCFRRIAEELLEGPVVPKNMQYFNKVPKVVRVSIHYCCCLHQLRNIGTLLCFQFSKPTPPHQDGFYFMIKPQSAVTGCVSSIVS